MESRRNWVVSRPIWEREGSEEVFEATQTVVKGCSAGGPGRASPGSHGPRCERRDEPKRDLTRQADQARELRSQEATQELAEQPEVTTGRQLLSRQLPVRDPVRGDRGAPPALALISSTNSTAFSKMALASASVIRPATS